MSDENFKEEILKIVGDEFDSAIIKIFDTDGVSEENQKVPDKYFKKCVELKEVINFLDYTYDNDYGGQECHDIIIWTNTKIIFVHEYDGSTSLWVYSRNPTNEDK